MRKPYILSIGDIIKLKEIAFGIIVGMGIGLLSDQHITKKEKVVVNHCFTSTFLESTKTFHRINCPWR